MKVEYRETEEFKKDFKKLAKRFPTLPEDLETAKKNAIELYPLLRIDNQSVFQINDLNTAAVEFYKLKKFACKSLKGLGVHSGIRIIYAYRNDSRIVELLEINFKGDKEETEDRARIRSFLKS